MIEEIEKEGIDRKWDLDFLVSKDKIVLLATHDHRLALMAERRVVIKNGGVRKIIETTHKERECLKIIEEIDNRLLSLRDRLRSGELIEDID